MTEDVTSLRIKLQCDDVPAAEDKLRKLTEAGKRTENQVERLGRTSQDSGEKMKRSFSETEKAADKLNKSFSAARVSLGVMTAATGALSVAAGVSVRGWLDYDKAIKEVRSITGQSAKEFEHFRSEVLAVASAIGVDATIAARGLYEALSAGVPRENAIEFLKVASKAAIAGVTDVKTAVDGLTNVFNAFKVPVTDAERVASKFLQTVNDGKTTFPDMAKNMADAAVPMAALGGSYEELFAQISAITSQGKPTSEAFTMVRASITALFNPSKEMEAVFKDMGVTSGRAAVAQYGFAGALDFVAKKYAGNDAALFKAMRDTNGFSQILATTGKNAEQLGKFYANLTKESDNLSSAYAVNAETLEVSLNKLKGAAISLVEKMEKSMGPIKYFTGALAGAAEMIDRFSGKDFSPETKSLIDSGDGGTAGESVRLKKQIELLTERKKLLEAKFSTNPPNYFDYAQEASPIGKLLPNEPLENVGNLLKTTEELKLLNAEYAKIDETTKKIADNFVKREAVQDQINETSGPSGDLLPNIELTAEQRNLEAKYAENLKKQYEGLNAEGDQLLQNKENILQIDSELAALNDREAAEAVARTLAAEKQAGIETQAAADKIESEKEILSFAQQNGINERQKAEADIAKYEKVKEIGNATKEQILYADQGIAKLREELLLLDEKGEKILKANSVSDEPEKSNLDKESERIAQSFDMTPIFETPSQSQFEELARQEEEISKSYNRRMSEILSLTTITEEERAALVHKTDRELAESQRFYAMERKKETIAQVGDMYGNLATMASVFGKKGHKIAQVAAIGQAVISTYQAANKALAQLPPPFSYVAMGAAIATGLANVAKIKSTEYAGAYAEGGIIPGMSFSGDKLTASVNSGEMVLNKGQQKNLFDIANNGGAGGGVIVNIVNNSGEQVLEKRSRQGDKELVEFIIGKATDKVAEDIRKGGTKVASAVQSTYNLSRG